MMNGDDDVDTFNKDDDDEDDDRYDLSPPAKKPSPVTMMPLPGLAGRVCLHLLLICYLAT